MINLPQCCGSFLVLVEAPRQRHSRVVPRRHVRPEHRRRRVRCRRPSLHPRHPADQLPGVRAERLIVRCPHSHGPSQTSRWSKDFCKDCTGQGQTWDLFSFIKSIDLDHFASTPIVKRSLV